MFNLWRHLRNAASVVLFFAGYFRHPGLLALGMILLLSSLVGGLDLAERRIELLEKEKKSNETTETPESR